ncbi:MAG: SDR family NAD(P)-dependent oxidoreductase [Pseudomonadota bacterium]
MTGKLVWITGAGTGIGAAAAKRLAEAGCRLVLSGRRAERLQAVAAETGGHIQVLDVMDRDAVAAAGAEIAESHGTVDILVNNAGINVPNRHWSEVSTTDWEAIHRINVDGVFYCTQAVLPAMRVRKEGQIINISSWAGVRPSFLTGPAYTAAKHAVNALTENLNMEECVNGIRATAICPGEVSTEIMDKRPVPIPAEIRAKMVQPEDMGQAIWFVAAQPEHVCLNQMVVSPTWNRGYVKFHDGAGLE